MKYEECVKTCATPVACHKHGCTNDDELFPPTATVESDSKYSPEQIAYLDQCAIAAMKEIISSQYYRHVKTIGEISETAHDFAEAMLQERTKRLEK